MKHLIFDTETTALVSNSLRPIDKQPRIIEFFGYLIDKDQFDLYMEDGWDDKKLHHRQLHTYIDPGIDIPEEVTKITGITKEKLKGAPPFKDVADEIKRFIESADVVVAHNISYDMSVVDFELSRIGRTVAWPRRRICTVEHTECIKGHRLKLMDLHLELFGIGFEKAHSAENDVKATTRCYMELMKRGEI